MLGPPPANWSTTWSVGSGWSLFQPQALEKSLRRAQRQDEGIQRRRSQRAIERKQRRKGPVTGELQLLGSLV